MVQIAAEGLPWQQNGILAGGFNRRRFWQKVKGEGKRACKTSGSIEVKAGELLTGKEEEQRRWRGHSSELLLNEGLCKSDAGG